MCATHGIFQKIFVYIKLFRFVQIFLNSKLYVLLPANPGIQLQLLCAVPSICSTTMVQWHCQRAKSFNAQTNVKYHLDVTPKKKKTLSVILITVLNSTIIVAICNFGSLDGDTIGLDNLVYWISK